MSRTSILLGSFVSILLSQAVVFGAPAPQANDHSRWIIMGDSSGAQEEIKWNGGQVFRQLHHRPGAVVHTNPHFIDHLRKKYPELTIQEDVRVQVAPLKIKHVRKTTGDQQIPWGITAVKATMAQKTNRGAGVTVCVVDTGIDRYHPDLAQNVIGGRNFVYQNGTLDPNRWDDDFGHGTHVAGIIAAEDNGIGVIGVAPQALLYSVKVLDENGTGYWSDVGDGIYECVFAGTKVINMSLTAYGDPTFEGDYVRTALDYAKENGVIAVAAAGNAADSISHYMPAGFPNVIAVSAVDSNFVLAPFSNFGLSTKDFAGPGVDVFSTYPGGGYATMSGTSMAAPHVAGVAALYVAEQSARMKATDIHLSVSSEGAGLINAFTTVKAKH